MCGIAGLVTSGGGGRERVGRALDAIAHRGPDGSGYFEDAGVHLGHRRLAIIDLRDVSNQPMTTKDGALTIIFNGEIYNYIELRDQLRSQGAVFETDSDTEVILKSYEMLQERCVDTFNGMWSFVIYDRKRRVLFCSRDRFGEKPFFYAQRGGEFFFGSEVKALIAMGLDTKLKTQFIKNFLFWERYENALTSQFEGVEYLPGGHSMLFDIEKGATSVWKYYSLAERLIDLGGISFEDAKSEFRLRLKESVRLRNRADVPVGIALSSGIDSSLIAAEVAELVREGKLLTSLAVNADAELEEISESEAARETAALLGIPYAQVSAKMVDPLDTVIKAHWHQESPAVTMSFIMSWNLYAQFRKRGVPVALDGQGGDEIMLGYVRYAAIPIYELLAQGKVGEAAALVRALAENSDDFRLGRMMAICAWGWSQTAKTANRFRRSMISPDMRTLFPSNEASSIALRRHAPAQVLEIERGALPGLLRTADRNSMAHSVEARLPFLDSSVVEFAVSLPAAVKFQGGVSKSPSRRLVSEAGLKHVAEGRRKLGFHAPGEVWMQQLGEAPFDYVSRSPVLKALVGDLLTREKFDALGHDDRWRLFSVAISESQYGVA